MMVIYNLKCKFEMFGEIKNVLCLTFKYWEWAFFLKKTPLDVLYWQNPDCNFVSDESFE